MKTHFLVPFLFLVAACGSNADGKTGDGGAAAAATTAGAGGASTTASASTGKGSGSTSSHDDMGAGGDGGGASTSASTGSHQAPASTGAGNDGGSSGGAGGAGGAGPATSSGSGAHHATGSGATGGHDPSTGSTGGGATSGATTTTGSGGGNKPRVCGKVDKSASPDKVCDACITASCCTEWDAVVNEPDTSPYLACILGPNFDGAGGCEASNPPSTDPGGFADCWYACAHANVAGQQATDGLNVCLAENCLDTVTECEGTRLTPGACDSGFTFFSEACDECVGQNCCTGLADCLNDASCNADENACAANPNDPACASDPAAGTIAACVATSCASVCTF